MISDMAIIDENERNRVARHCRIKLVRLKSRPDYVVVIY